MEENKTIITTYGDAKEMMDYVQGFCPCCKYELFEEWYAKKTDYFVEKGFFVMDGLMHDTVDGKLIRYCFTFDTSDIERVVFTIYNYYKKDKVCTFYFKPGDNDDIADAKIIMEHYNIIKWNELNGSFLNPEILKKTRAIWATKPSRLRGKKITAQLKIEKDVRREVDFAIHEFMCQHTVHFFLSTMFYFSRQKPDEVENPFIEEATQTQEAISQATSKESVKYNYKYTGYIDLTKTRVYKAKTCERLNEEKREYERHIQSWAVRGHYRRINGKRIWIKEHQKGERQLENRVYGTVPEEELTFIPKVFEIKREREVVAQESQLCEPSEKAILQPDVSLKEIAVPTTTEQTITPIQITKPVTTENIFIRILKRIFKYFYRS